MNYCFCVHGGNLCHMRKIRWGEFLTFVCNLCPSYHRKSSQNWKKLAFCAHGVSFSLGDQSPSACFCHFFLKRHGFYLEIDSYWCR